MADFENIQLDVKEKIATLKFNRPPLNVLNIAMMSEINGALKTLQTSSDYRVLVIKGEGKAFSAGVDVSEHIGDKAEEMIRVFHDIFRNLVKIEQPIIGVLNGAALGGGCEIVLFCDLVIASEKAKIGQPEIQVGVFPPLAAAVLPKLVGIRKTLEIALIGDTLTADEGYKLGLINKIFKVEEFEQESENYIKKIASLSGPVLKFTKKACMKNFVDEFDGILREIEDIYLNELMKTEDANEGLSSFLEKRKPEWKDK